jgi:hypothetical protein
MIWFVLLSLVGCADGQGGGVGEGSGLLLGTWEFETLEVGGMTTDCPGEITIVPVIWACPEGSFSYSADGTFVAVAAASANDPAYRGEGTWSTVDDTLTMTYVLQGSDADNLVPVEPPESWVAKWSVSGTTLELVDQDSPSAPSATYTLEKR